MAIPLPSLPRAPFSGGRAVLMLHGSDGSTWHLTTGDEGVLATRGIDGLGLPTFEVFTDDQAGLPGARYQGRRTQVRKLTVPVLVEPSFPRDWYAVDAAWWQALEELAALEVVRGNDSRMLDVRLDSGTDDGFDHDPGIDGKQQYSVKLAAYAPFYRGNPVIADVTYQPAADPGLFWGGAFGNPFSQQVSADFARMQIANPGDVAAWPTWQVYGPCDGVDVGVDDDRVVWAGRIDAGRSITVVSDPEVRDVVDDMGVSVFGGLIRQDWAAVPNRSVVSLAPVPANPGDGCRVITRLIPRWRRPW